MGQSLIVQLSDAAYAALELRAREAAKSPAELAAAALEQRYGILDRTAESGSALTDPDRQAARQRFERHFGAVNLGGPTGADNEAIDADLARAYADSHEDG